MKPIMKWPGGKSGEVAKIKDMFPAHSRFIEPFFGGGAVFFYLEPSSAIINDHSETLMSFYRLVKNQDPELYRYLTYYDHSFQTAYAFAKSRVQELFRLFEAQLHHHDTAASANDQINGMVQSLLGELSLHDSKGLILDHDEFFSHLCDMVSDKFARTQANCTKGMIGGADIEDNLMTGFLSGYYMYHRKVMNDIALGRTAEVSLPYKIANFLFYKGILLRFHVPV